MFFVVPSRITKRSFLYNPCRTQQARVFILEALKERQQFATPYNPEQALYDDTTTWLAEVLDGNMRTEFCFGYDGQELYGQDGSPLGKVFYDSISDAECLAEEQPNLLFELRRRHLEYQEYQEMLEMAKGERPNTMIVVSDFPPELMQSYNSVGGYNVSRKQTMLRIITARPDGSLNICSQSLDGSNRTALEKIYHSFGMEPEVNQELLGQRIHLNVTEEDQKLLADRLTRVYDESLSEQFGGQWHAGRNQASNINTFDFVRMQDDLLQVFLEDEDAKNNPKDAIYSLAAAMEKRFLLTSTSFTQVFNTPSMHHSTDRIRAELMIAGQEAKQSGKTFSGCGMSLGSSNAQMEATEELGYGNKTSKESSYKFDKYMHCVVCQAPPKDNESKKMCGPCGICKACDIKFK